MVFGFFTRKAPQTDTAADAGPSALESFQFPKPQQQQHTPAPSVDSSSSLIKNPSPEATPPGPVDTPSPGPDDPQPDEIADPSVLHALIASVPPQTLHAYTLAHLLPAALPASFPFTHPSGLVLHTAPAPPTPRTLGALAAFFASLAPPPKLHCVRCHKGYFELENADSACRVPHDDESALVERVRMGGEGARRGRAVGVGECETLYGCCGQTVEGAGDQGPPDGWCYEGKHTTDTKRARFRADSSPSDDKLTSCASLRCGQPPLPLRSTRGHARKRSRRTMMEDNADDDSARSVSSSLSRRRGHARSASMSSSKKGKRKAITDEEDQEDQEDQETKPRPAKRARARKASTILKKTDGPTTTKKENGEATDSADDDVNPPLALASPPKSWRRHPLTHARRDSRPDANARPPTRSPALKPNPFDPPATRSPRSSSNARPSEPVASPASQGSPQPRPRPTPQKSPLSASFVAPAPCPASPRAESPTRRRVEVELVSRSRSPVRAASVPQAPQKKGSVASLRSLKAKGSVGSLEKAALEKQGSPASASAGTRGRPRITEMPKVRARSPRVRVLEEVVDTSVGYELGDDAEEILDW